MSNSDLFGQIITGGHVEQAVAAAMSEWMDDYLYELERDPILGYQPGQIQRPLGIVASSELDKWPEDQLPVILVLSPGLNKPPTLRGEGIYDSEWQVALAPVVSDTDQQSTRTLAMAYAAAVRAALVQHAMLKSSLFPAGFAHYVDWLGEDYTNVPFAQTRTMMAGRVVLAVGVESTVQKQAGPRTPLVDPASTPPPAETFDEVDVTQNTTLVESIT